MFEPKTLKGTVPHNLNFMLHSLQVRIRPFHQTVTDQNLFGLISLKICRTKYLTTDSLQQYMILHPHGAITVVTEMSTLLFLDCQTCAWSDSFTSCLTESLIAWKTYFAHPIQMWGNAEI